MSISNSQKLKDSIYREVEAYSRPEEHYKPIQDILKKSIILVSSVLYRIYLFTLICCAVVTGRTEKRWNLPACFLKHLYCGHLTPLLLAIFLPDLTCSLLSLFKKQTNNSFLPSVKGTLELVLYRVCINSPRLRLVWGGEAEGRKKGERTPQASLGFHPPAFGWTQHSSVCAGCWEGEISAYPSGFFWLI